MTVVIPCSIWYTVQVGRLASLMQPLSFKTFFIEAKYKFFREKNMNERQPPLPNRPGMAEMSFSFTTEK